MMSGQITDKIFMVRPIAFQRNEQTAVNNLFQPRKDIMDEVVAQHRALDEFDDMVSLLKSRGIDVNVFNDNDDAETPDSIFPNNWNSFHPGMRIFLYPMFAPNRRKERREDILKAIAKKYNAMFRVKSFEHYEEQGMFLEGTGSLVLDRENDIAYAALAERTHPEVLEKFAQESSYRVVSFTANQTFNDERLPIYHTNVMMCVGDDFALICDECIDDPKEREIVLDSLKNTGKEIIQITEIQRDHFAGNMLQLQNNIGEKFVVMSSSAFNSLTKAQIESLGKYGEILHSPIPTIEKLGGGSVRCMIAEIFL